MKRALRLERTYLHPPELVWRALTEPSLVAEWLMDNDFAPAVGHRFTLRTDPQPGFDGIVHCEVLEIDAPNLMRWSWRGGPIDTVVTFELQPAPLADASGTRLVMRQTGFDGLPAVLVSYILGAGFTGIYDRRLPAVLDRLAGRPASPAPVDGPMRGRWRFLTRLFAPILRRGERRNNR
jgi:uncharacterized protein YndB with AHSA1/START domain